MSEASQSPFKQHRYEHAGKHLYFLPEEPIEIMEQSQPVILIGTRGTGKTTLLRALNWDERLNNDALRSQIPQDPFADRYIGLYLKLPETQLAAVDRWLKDEEDEMYLILMSLYLDLVWGELLATAISELAIEGVVEISADGEASVAQSALGLIEGLPTTSDDSAAGPHRLKSCRELADLIQRARRGIERASLRRVNVSEATNEWPLYEAGGLGRRLATELLSTCSGQGSAEAWYTQVCMDEGETLSRRQQLAMNSVLRLARWPVSYIIAYVREPDDLTATMLPGLSLQKADRSVIPIDRISDQEFRRLAEGVVSVRARALLDNDTIEFDASQILGKLDLNRLLQDVLTDSVSSKAKELLSTASQFDGDSAEEGDSTDAPPIYQTYLVRYSSEGLPTSEEPEWYRRRFDSAQLRKKMVAAYLSICHEMGASPRYAYSDMVFQMSDRCIRDFLWQFEEIFVESGLQLDSFINRGVGREGQHRALKRASNQKLERLTDIVVAAPDQTARIIDGLGSLTAMLQSQSPDGSHLRSTEPGRFVVGLSRGGIDDEVYDMVMDAAETGYLRLLGADKDKVAFRVHTSLAAAYGFSYRGAYYGVALEPRDIEGLRAANGSEEVEACVRGVFRRCTAQSGPVSHPTLFQEDGWHE